MVMDFQVTFDCAAPVALADFWASALGYRPADPPEGFASWEEWAERLEIPAEEWGEGAWLDDPEKQRPRIHFQRVPEPKTVKNRVHLDLDASDGPAAPLERRKEQVDAEAARLVALGAKRFAIYEATEHYHIVMRDPEGNEFCLR